MAVDVIAADMLDDGNALAAARALSKACYGSSAFVAMQPTARLFRSTVDVANIQVGTKALMNAVPQRAPASAPPSSPTS
jgi:hypothetical protein